ncbi:GntR family transcriptional regulator [Flavobacteriaceae bacterium TP-CH-4]|uniref:GntR family transcriptional regulator n=1 Tax=Pelagihabitans pacificus TaxID=2696054 RepID=A0A967E641_9FLAO|nr:S1-like domain-containing RNA-binding protein [Pelagihabitans pacificus]NHF59235.1 GntR family transcriptional regulator [Pelagihabitans pacificus]
MIELGNYNTLKIARDTSVGLFLESDTGVEILLPNKYVPKVFEIGDELTVFCYLDHEERPVATSLNPFIKRNTFGFLQVVEVNKIGAFLDWGLEKQLLVPFREQREKMKEGQWYVVYCYMDEQSFRLVASNKLDKFLSNEAISVGVGDEVDLLVTRLTDLGWEVIINDKHKGLVFLNDVFKRMAVGNTMKGYIKNIRSDNKIDVVLQPLGKSVLEPTADKIYRILLDHGGYLPLHDKSDPKTIAQELEMSKKTFKKGIGTLYKARKITIKDDGIYAIS